MSPTELEELGSRITCAQAIDFILAYLDGDLPQGQQEIFTAHLAICEDCRNYLASYMSSIELLNQASNTRMSQEQLPPVPDDLLNAIMKTISVQAEKS